MQELQLGAYRSRRSSHLEYPGQREWLHVYNLLDEIFWFSRLTWDILSASLSESPVEESTYHRRYRARATDICLIKRQRAKGNIRMA